MAIKLNIKNIEKQLSKAVEKIVEEKQFELNAQKRFKENRNMIILNKVEEELLTILIQKRVEDSYLISGDYSVFPDYIYQQLKELFKNLKIAGYIASSNMWLGGNWQVTITPMAISYLTDKAEYMKKEDTKIGNQYNIGNLTNNAGNIIFGNMENSKIIISDSFKTIENEINEKGGEDKDELMLVFEEIKKYIEMLENKKEIKTDKNLFEKMGTHFKKHEWFYSSIISLFGQTLIMKIGQ